MLICFTYLLLLKQIRREEFHRQRYAYYLRSISFRDFLSFMSLAALEIVKAVSPTAAPNPAATLRDVDDDEDF